MMAQDDGLAAGIEREAAGGQPPARPLRDRWMACALLFASTTITYVDRQVIGLSKAV